jgi:phosphatidate cytidylyltransferase
MLGTRLIVGTILAALAAAMILLDEHFAPWFPFLYATMALLASLSALELLTILPTATRPKPVLTMIGVLVIFTLAWGPIFTPGPVKAQMHLPDDAAHWVLTGFVALVLTAFIAEMATYRVPGQSVQRLALTVWIFAYLGVLPSFLAMLRTSRASASPDDLHRGTIAVALAVFVPKCCDIGAYFTGRFLGRHKMAPILSPKKTWEGAIGGLVTTAIVTVGINQFGPVITGGWGHAIVFGIVVGLAGMLGDLAESMIKRDCTTKDASQTIPGFGGVLDVVDAILFAAPVVYWLLQRWGDG